MKVLRILSELDFGGVEQVALNSFPPLNKHVTLQVLVLNKGGKVSQKLEEKGVSIKILNVNPRIPNFKLIRLIQTEIRLFQPDVVHAQGAEANFHGVLPASFEKVPVIIAEEIGIPNHHPFWKWVFRWVYSRAHQVIAISEAVKKEIEELGEVSSEKVRVVYNPVDYKRLEIGDPDRYQERLGRIERKEIVQRTNLVRGQDEEEETEKSFVFVTTCRLVPIKNLDRLIEAFGGLVRENPKRKLVLWIVGEGRERGNLESLSQKLEMVGNVEFFGYQEDVWLFLLESDVFILPSLREGSSVSLAEAMSTGLPSIVTQVGGTSEILGQSNSGILIDPLSVEHIQSAMQEMVSLSLEERLKMGERAKEEAKRFSTVHYINSLLFVYGLSEFRLKPSDI